MFYYPLTIRGLVHLVFCRCRAERNGFVIAKLFVLFHEQSTI